MDIDIIGTLFDPPEVEGGEPIVRLGWHVNITRRGLLYRPQLSDYLVNPAPLRRVWAGDDPGKPETTVALRFADEAEALALLGLES